MNSFEIQALKILDTLNIKDQTLLLGVSGGLDSIVMSEVLTVLAARRNLQLIFGYVHHGESSLDQAEVVDDYRNKTCKFVMEFANQKKVKFVTTKYSGGELKSEFDLRDYRLAALEKLRLQERAHFIVLAHHANDLLETRLIRLLRGVGPQGLRSMSVSSGVILRPLLDFTRDDLKNYALSRGLEWVEDPSNSNIEPFRNWIRTVWLPMVEEKRIGSTRTLMSSLNSLTQDHIQDNNDDQSLDFTDGVSRLELAKLTFREQRRVLAQYVLSSGLKDYSVTHLDEILKRLDSPQKDFTFNLLKREWHVDTKRIRVESES